MRVREGWAGMAIIAADAALVLEGGLYKSDSRLDVKDEYKISSNGKG